MSTVVMSVAPTGKRSRFALADLPVSTKVLASVSVAGLVAVVVGLSGLLALSSATKATERLYGNVDATGAVGELNAAMLQSRLTLGNHAVSRDQATKAKYEQTFAENLKAVDAAFATYRGTDPFGDPAILHRLEANW
ncbi:Tar ligand binding domain-containing protein [Paractinoplanes maris]|uniref:Tar ligand binding domain-containing protein n=1 Tax=Paractinoplanes maris TaxID=1734446 RepID=UPI0027E1F45B|nr:Tar ligand binding domain-containing protein [Actinoplanes maris]